MKGAWQTLGCKRRLPKPTPFGMNIKNHNNKRENALVIAGEFYNTCSSPNESLKIHLFLPERIENFDMYVRNNLSSTIRKTCIWKEINELYSNGHR